MFSQNLFSTFKNVEPKSCYDFPSPTSLEFGSTFFKGGKGGLY